MVYYRTTSTPCGTAPYGLGMWSQPACLCGLLTLWLALAILFKGTPEIDKAISTVFFAARDCTAPVLDKTCGKFPLEAMPFFKTLRFIFQYIPIVGVAVIAGILWRDGAAGLRWPHERVRIATIALLTYALGPGLLVNVMKLGFGRPRPANTLLFGGDHHFVAAAEWSNACFRNCSFVSGEAAGMAWILCLLPLFAYSRRHRLVWPMIGVTLATGLLRVVFGRHYLSDVILGSLTTLIVFSAIACICEGLTNRFAVRSDRMATDAVVA
jgi:lipid A 4'-phosphatase